MSSSSVCFLCDVAANVVRPPLWHDVPVALSADARTFALPALGSLAPGHVLVSPALHVHSVQTLGADDRRDFIALLDDVVSFLEEQGPVTLFEHGASAAGSGARSACTDHAHVQVLPGDYELDLQHKVHACAASPAEFYSSPAPFDGYLVHRDPGHVMSAAPDPGVSQYYRRRICDLQGEPHGWDYWVIPRLDSVQATYERFSLFGEWVRLNREPRPPW
jgi:diadenosine tetraphosphate (Ap4A) HIT family hydrolase